MASLSSSTPKDTEGIDKILGVSVEGYLLDISLSTGSSQVLIESNNPINGCSFSPPINNRYVYMVGGMKEYVDNSDLLVFCYDLVDGTIQKGPLTMSPKFQPKLILLGSKLFSFSAYRYFFEHICEMLDTMSPSPGWRPLKICLNLPFFNDHLPSHRHNSHICYHVVSYATHMNNLFVCLACVYTSVSLCYNDSIDSWSNISEMPLPFYGQGKFVDDICYGFPIPENKSTTNNNVITRGGNNYYLASYKLLVNWESSSLIVSCQELAKYSLFSITPLPYSSSLCSFFVSSSNVFTIIREATIPKRHSSDVKKHSLQVDVVQLLSSPTMKRQSPTMKTQLLAPIKKINRPLSPPLHSQFNEISDHRPHRQFYENPSYREVLESYPYVLPATATATETTGTDIDDTEYSSQLLMHMDILLPHPLEAILGDYNPES